MDDGLDKDKDTWQKYNKSFAHRWAGPILFSNNLNSGNGEQIRLFEDKPIFLVFNVMKRRSRARIMRN